MNWEKSFWVGKGCRLVLALALLAVLALVGCGAKDGVAGGGKRDVSEDENAKADSSRKKQGEGDATSQPAASPSPKRDGKDGYIASDEKYNLHLPGADAFGKIFKEFVCWEYATQIEKREKKLEDEQNILGNLKGMGLLDGEVKIRMYYRECDMEEMDYGESNLYNVIVGFPESKDSDYPSWLSMDYSCRGLSSRYDWEYCGWLDSIQQISFEKLEQNKKFQKKYTCMGETSIAVSETEAKAYQPENKFAEGEKEHILAKIDLAVRKEYKDAKDTMVFIHDFLPGDFNLSGKEVDFDMKSKDDMPVYWIRSGIGYLGNRLEKFDGIDWQTHYSTAYSGASQPDYNPTVKFLEESAEREAQEIDMERCILAYYVKNGEPICYNDQRLIFTEKGMMLGSNDYSCLLTEEKVRNQLGIPDGADIKIKYGKEIYWKDSFGANIVEVDVYEKGRKERVAGGFFLIKDGSAGCNLMSYEASGN